MPPAAPALAPADRPPTAPAPAAPSPPIASACALAVCDSWRISTSARPMPFLARFWLVCWSSMVVNILLCWLSIMPSCGVASRMLFIIMLTNIASNWVAAPFSASGAPALADWRSSPMLLVSMASLLDRSFWLIIAPLLK